MKIKIVTEGKTLKFSIPAKIALKFVLKFSNKKHLSNLSKKEINAFINDAFKLLKKAKKEVGSFNLVEFESTDGNSTIVKV